MSRTGFGTEPCIRSNECSELATRHESVNRAKNTNPNPNTGTDTNVYVQTDAELEANIAAFTKEDNMRKKLQKKDRRRKKRENRLGKKKEKWERKISKMSPEEQNAAKERLRVKEVKKEKWKEMSKEERKAFNREQKEKRLLKKKERIEVQLAKLKLRSESDKQEQFVKKERKGNKKKRTDISKEEKQKLKKELYENKQKVKEAKRKAKWARMPPEKAKIAEEVFEHKQKAKAHFQSLSESDKRKIRTERKEQYEFVKKNWLPELETEICNEYDVIIVDGNNVRGGGPRRRSQQEIIDHTAKVVNKLGYSGTIIVMFDGNVRKYKSNESIDEVVFSSFGIEADDVIVQTVRDNPEKNYLVVTCDRGLAQRVLELKGKIIRNGTFTNVAEGLRKLRYRH